MLTEEFIRMKKVITLGLGLTVSAVLATAGPVAIGNGSSVTPGSVTTLPTSAAFLTASGSYIFPGAPAPPQDIAGTYIEWAYADASNPLGHGDTTIVLQLTDTNGPATIERATLSNFTAASLTDVAYLNTSSVAPTGATKDVNGDVIGFAFAGLTKGEVETLIVYTNDTNATLTGTVSIQNGTTGYNNGISPSSVPEPVSMSLLGGGLALLGALRFRRNK
jgi:hypothetical protein